MAIVYNGFSTLINTKKFSITDYALARQDLINYFNIRKGEKLMQPNFGTIIWNMLFEPLNETTQQTITGDIRRIVGYDPRLRTDNVTVIQATNGLEIQISLTYIPANQADTLLLNFNNQSNTLTTN
jgi:phage baseplate assembly protein W